MTKKTIRMPKKLLAKWLKALRSGEYKQAYGTLYNPKSCGFCCLGVLQHVASNGSVEGDFYGDYYGLPTRKWLDANGISFFGKSGYLDNSPFLPTIDNYASEANDAGMRFKSLARAIEACAEGY